MPIDAQVSDEAHWPLDFFLLCTVELVKNPLSAVVDWVRLVYDLVYADADVESRIYTLAASPFTDFFMVGSIRSSLYTLS